MARGVPLTLAVLALAVALGTALRLIPTWRGADPALLSDAAFHLRMTRAVGETGRVPRVDSLANAPIGREPDRLLPGGYHAKPAAFHRLASAFGASSLERNVRVFTALAGGLVAVPVFGAAWAVTRRRDAALLAAFIAVLLPAHLHRTFGYWFRYDAVGSVTIATHVACSLGALAARGRRTALLLAAAAGLSLIGALAVWRVSFMIVLLEAGFVLAWALVRPPGDAVRRWFTAVAGAGTLACLALGYLREQTFVLSTGWLLAMTTAAALWTPWLRREEARRSRRALALAAAVAMAVAAGTLVPRDRQYVHVADAAARKVLLAVGVTASPPPALTAVALRIEELEGSDLTGLIGPGGLSWLGVWFLAAPLVWWLHARRRPRGALAPAPALLGLLCVTLTAITLLFARNKVVLAPLAAAVLGGLPALLLARGAAARPAPGAGPRRGSVPSGGSGKARGEWSPRAPRPGPASWALLALFALSLALTARDAVRLALTRSSRMEPGLAAALDHLARDGASRGAVLSTWERGYEIQAYTGRPSLTDGLLEDPETGRRIVAIARSWLEPTTDSLAALCGRYGATHLLVPPSRYLYATAMLTDWPAASKVRDGVPLSREEARPVMVRMMVLGESPAPFEKGFEREDWRVYRLAEATPAAPATGVPDRARAPNGPAEHPAAPPRPAGPDGAGRLPE